MEGYGVFILLCFVMPAVNCLRFTKKYSAPLIKYYRNRTNVELRWEWTLDSGEVMAPLKIKRYQKEKALVTEKTIASYYTGGTSTDDNKYKFNVANQVNGYASFVIKDLTNQGTNKDGTTVDVMKENEVYVYVIEIDVQGGPSGAGQEYKNEVELQTLKIPVITTYPRNQTASGGTVTFECVADGKPKPTAKWEKIGSSQSFSDGPRLTITDFDASKIGVYRCTAKSVGIAENANATAFVQFSTCGAGCTKEELGIEFPDLVYNYEYGNQSYTKYKELKNRIEIDCLTVYALKGKLIYKCEVLRYRRGSVVAVVELGWPTNTPDPKQPLLQAINYGNFAGYRVKPKLVKISPTWLPVTPIPITTPTAIFPIVTERRSTAGPPERDTGCSISIAICVIIIVLLVLCNVVLGLFMWRMSSKLKEVTNNMAQLPRTEHPLSAINGMNIASMVNRGPEVPTAPIYHDIINTNNRPSAHSGQLYQTLNINDQQPSQSYQTLDVTRRNVNTPMETSEPGNYQILQENMPPPTYGELYNAT